VSMCRPREQNSSTRQEELQHHRCVPSTAAALPASQSASPSPPRSAASARWRARRRWLSRSPTISFLIINCFNVSLQEHQESVTTGCAGKFGICVTTCLRSHTGWRRAQLRDCQLTAPACCRPGTDLQQSLPHIIPPLPICVLMQPAPAQS
jgi:hypothetical protein